MNEKEQIFAKLNQNLHAIGRAMSIATVILLVAVPFLIGTLSGGKLDVKGFLLRDTDIYSFLFLVFI